MTNYMINISLPNYYNEDFAELIPEQKLHIDKLMSENVVRGYALSLDKTKLWTTIAANSEEEVVKILHTFPLIDWIKYEIFPLIIHRQPVQVPAISLN